MSSRNGTRGRFSIMAAAFAIVGIFSIPEDLGGQGGTAPSGNQSTIILSLKTAEGPASNCSNASLAAAYFTDPRSGQVQALKIKGANGGTDYYYFSYRQALGFSSVLRPQYVATTSVTRWNGVTGARTFLLANLEDGQAFTDSSTLRVTQRSHDAMHAYITVSFDTPERSYAKQKP